MRYTSLERDLAANPWGGSNSLDYIHEMIEMLPSLCDLLISFGSPMGCIPSV